MDYEKKYNKTLEWLHERINYGCFNEEQKQMFHSRFPELAKSENERISKEIVRIVDIWTNSSPVVNGIPREKLLAYLEKQKDCEAEIEKAYKTADKIQYEKGFNDGVESVKLAEWSEEDERRREQAIYALERAGFYVLVDWLKALRPQPKQEWSEDDEQYLLVCKNALNKYQRSDHWDANIISKWLEEKLKFLCPKPHWKPSKEQMKALEYALARGGNYNREALETLFKKLKQLKYDRPR